jgi:NADP-dependent 3-hydroxy acid dehydrogenase YdfG
MSRNIEGKVVVITGASSGLGESVARHLATLGAAVVLGARRKDLLNTIVRRLRPAAPQPLCPTYGGSRAVTSSTWLRFSA